MSVLLTIRCLNIIIIIIILINIRRAAWIQINTYYHDFLPEKKVSSAVVELLACQLAAPRGTEEEEEDGFSDSVETSLFPLQERRCFY